VWLQDDDSNAASWIDNDFTWNDIGDLSFEATSSTPNMVANLNSFDGIYASAVQITDFGGVLKNNTYKGIFSNVRDTSTGLNRPPMMDSENQTYEFPVNMYYGSPISRTYTNREIYGWIKNTLVEYGTVLSNPPTISEIGGKLHLRASDSYPWTQGGSTSLFSCVGHTGATTKNVNFYFEDYSFIIEQAFTYSATQNMLFRTSHLGFTYMVRPTFDMQGVANYILTLSNSQTSGSGAWTLVDPIFKNGFSVVLRAGDRILYTKFNNKCATYADNATAKAAFVGTNIDGTADDGTGYFYKLTATGEPKITY
jgi:hypothetical protein